MAVSTKGSTRNKRWQAKTGYPEKTRVRRGRRWTRRRFVPRQAVTAAATEARGDGESMATADAAKHLPCSARGDGGARAATAAAQTRGYGGARSDGERAATATARVRCGDEELRRGGKGNVYCKTAAHAHRRPGANERLATTTLQADGSVAHAGTTNVRR